MTLILETLHWAYPRAGNPTTDCIREAARLIRGAKYLTAFTGAGSVKPRAGAGTTDGGRLRTLITQNIDSVQWN